MTVTFKAMKPSMGQKAIYAVLVDGEAVGVVAHQRINLVRRHVRFPRVGATQHYTRRSRPLAWVARGTAGRKEVREVRRTRDQAVQALLDAQASTRVDGVRGVR